MQAAEQQEQQGAKQQAATKQTQQSAKLK